MEKIDIVYSTLLGNDVQEEFLQDVQQRLENLRSLIV